MQREGGEERTELAQPSWEQSAAESQCEIHHLFLYSVFTLLALGLQGKGTSQKLYPGLSWTERKGFSTPLPWGTISRGNSSVVSLQNRNGVTDRTSGPHELIHRITNVYWKPTLCQMWCEVLGEKDGRAQTMTSCPSGPLSQETGVPSRPKNGKYQGIRDAQT